MDAVPDFTFTIRPKSGCDRSLEDAVKHLASLLEKPLRVEVVGPSVEQFAAPLRAPLVATVDGLIDWSAYDALPESKCRCVCGLIYESHAAFVSDGRIHATRPRKPCPECGSVFSLYVMSDEPLPMLVGAK